MVRTDIVSGSVIVVLGHCILNLLAYLSCGGDIDLLRRSRDYAFIHKQTR
jgi:hypothetical protein